MEEHGGAVVLCDQQIDGAIVVVVTGDDGAWLFELNLVETDVGGDVFPSIGAEIAEETNFAFAVFGFADRDQIDPAVVVVVDGSDAESATPICLGQRHLLEALAVVITPEHKSRLV